MADTLVDILLGLILVGLATGALFSRTLLSCVALFVAFGVVLSLVWARLGAGDLALAEAAIGTGLTGALLLNAVVQGRPGGYHKLLPQRWWLLGICLVSILAGIFAWALAEFPPEHNNGALTELVDQHMGSSGVSHPVTAVLLNFRAWDTLLELAVLLLALLGIKQLKASPAVASLTPWPLLLAWSKALAPLLLLLGGYLLWRGSQAPGGAFQAGAVLAAGAVLLRLNQLLPPLRWSAWPLRFTVLIGLGVFVGVAVSTAWVGEGWLNYPAQYSAPLILLIEAAATLSIAVILTLLVVGEEKDLLT